jgi:hypothetical protein
VPGGEGHGLVEEEKLGITVRGHDYPVTAPKFENTRDPAPAFVGSDYIPVSVVQRAAAVAHDRAASGSPNEVAEGIETVLEGHPRPSCHTRRLTRCDSSNDVED